MFTKIKEKIKQLSGKKGYKVVLALLKILLAILMIIITLAIVVFIYLMVSDYFYDEKQDEFNENGEVIEE